MEAIDGKICDESCHFYPQQLLGSMLKPLFRRNNEALARQWEERLTLAAPVSMLYLNCVGDRCAFLALDGRHAAAAELRKQGERLAAEPGVSLWQKMRFHQGAARSLVRAAAAGDCDYAAPEAQERHEAEAKRLEAALRKRNQAVS